LENIRAIAGRWAGDEEVVLQQILGCCSSEFRKAGGQSLPQWRTAFLPQALTMRGLARAAHGDAIAADPAFEPGPDVLGEAVEDENLEARHLVDLAQDDVCAGETGLDAAAGAEDAWMQVDARALGQDLASARAGDGDGSARFRYVGDGCMNVAQR